MFQIQKNGGFLRFFELGELNISEAGQAHLKFTPLKAGVKNVVMDLHTLIFEGEAKLYYDDQKQKVLEGYEVFRR